MAIDDIAQYNLNNQSNSKGQMSGDSGLSSTTNPYGYSGTQFYGLKDAGEPDPGRVNTYDNPSFLWPNNYYYNTSGNKVDIHRGYMRSLLTDPNVAPSYGGTGSAPNRRLFFQFNPQVLTRSVSQSVGTMNPLLQDPAQLSQPVPGTASFGFELFFNREQEVNNHRTEGRGGTSLPDIPSSPGKYVKDIPLAAELGVMADIMVLDTIIGQGISSDMVQTIKGFTDTQANLVEKQDAQAFSKQLGTYATEEGRKNYKPLDIDTTNLETQINANLGNSAFLNPLPVRVIFSSMFMVEGLVTSAEVTFTKFSANMVPTQCRVALNMYALYIGFAKKDTYLIKNLTDSADQQEKENKANEVTKAQIAGGLKKITSKATYGKSGENFTFKINFDRSDALKKLIEDKSVKDFTAQVYVYYYATNASDSPIDQKLFADSKTLLADEEGTSSIPLSKLTSGLDVMSSELDSFVKKARDDGKDYLTYKITVDLFGRGDYDSFLASTVLLPDRRYWNYPGGTNADKNDDDTQTWTNPSVIK